MTGMDVVLCLVLAIVAGRMIVEDATRMIGALLFGVLIWILLHAHS